MNSFLLIFKIRNVGKYYFKKVKFIRKSMKTSINRNLKTIFILEKNMTNVRTFLEPRRLSTIDRPGVKIFHALKFCIVKTNEILMLNGGRPILL